MSHSYLAADQRHLPLCQCTVQPLTLPAEFELGEGCFAVTFFAGDAPLGRWWGAL